MLRKDTDYAFRLLGHLGAHAGRPTTAQELSAQQDVPLGFAQKILRKLVTEGIVDSRPGRNGGFRLIKEPREVSLRDVVKAIQGNLALNDCMAGGCQRQAACPLSAQLEKMQRQMDDFFSNTTLQDVLGSADDLSGTIPSAREGRK